ncbi:MAG: adenylosuccinate synthase [Thermoanaerobaculia bacterium]
MARDLSAIRRPVRWVSGFRVRVFREGGVTFRAGIPPKCRGVSREKSWPSGGPGRIPPTWPLRPPDGTPGSGRPRQRLDFTNELEYLAPLVLKNIQTLAVLGGQWGDEGKGKLVDLLAERFDAVARYHGGHNAGHTVRFGEKHFALHLLPAGIFRGKQAWIGDGVVVDPEALLSEIDSVQAAGVEVEGLLKISDRAHLILCYHRLLDAAREDAAGNARLGTTLRGIGPAYETRAARSGIRMGSLRHLDTLLPKIQRLARELGSLAQALGLAAKIPPAEEVFESLSLQAKRLVPLVADTGAIARAHLRAGKSLLAEGAHGALLDLSAGTYPFVTSSTCASSGLAAGLRIPPAALSDSLVVVKAYTTRVGAGPHPTELSGEIGEYLRKRGNEFGTSTGRPRRTGWLDTVVARTAVDLSGASFLAVTKLDVLDRLPEIPVCTAYELDGERISEFPADVEDVEKLVPVYETLPGWQADTVGITDFEKLPKAARDYVGFLEGQCGATAVAVATGPRREETVLRAADVFWDRLPSR